MLFLHTVRNIALRLTLSLHSFPFDIEGVLLEEKGKMTNPKTKNLCSLASSLSSLSLAFPVSPPDS